MLHLLDEKILDTLTYERSKTWSNFLKICEVNDNGNDIPLNKLEEMYKDQNEDDLDAIEEAEEEDVEDDIKSTIMLRTGDNKEMLYQTLPIVQEHVRKWKEAGLDRILNTFDVKIIEQHVGDWLRRNNSAYGNTNFIQPSPSKSCHKRHKTKLGVDVNSSVESDESETEINHTFDTAHYICECPKCRVSICRECSNPMGTRGRYRRIPQNRAMYNCDELNEVQEQHQMQSLIHRCDQRKHERKLRYHSMHNPSKCLRKPRDVSSSSSSDDDRRDSRCMCSRCLRRIISQTAHPYYGYRSYQSHSQSYRDYHHRRLESSRRIHNTFSNKSICKLRREHAFGEDPLCSNRAHDVILTDEFFVPIKSIIDGENMYFKKQFSGKKQTSTLDFAKPTTISGFVPKTVPLSLLPQMNDKIKTVDMVGVEGNLKVIDQEQAAKSPTSTGKTMCKKRFKVHAIIDKTTTATNKKRKKYSNETDDSDIELKKALEVSRKTYLKEQAKFRKQENTSNITLHASSSIQLSENFPQREGTPNISFEASTSLQIPEKSTLSNQSVACNSTTVFNRTVKPSSRSLDNSISEQASMTKILSKRDVECTLVSSTTGCEEAAKQGETTVRTQRSDIKITKNGILLYAPKQIIAEKQAQCTDSSQNKYMLTEQSLIPIIGERRARRFLKYHTGSRSFDSCFYVYYRPTAKVVAMLSGDSKSLDLDSSSSSGSEVDIFEQVDRYGVVYTVLENPIKRD